MVFNLTMVLILIVTRHGQASIPKKACCCSCAGGAWGSPCESCLHVGTAECAELCPGGPETINPDPENPNVLIPIDQCLEFPEVCEPNGVCE